MFVMIAVVESKVNRKQNFRYFYLRKVDNGYVLVFYHITETVSSNTFLNWVNIKSIQL